MSNLNSPQNARGAWLMIGGMAVIGFVDNFIGPMAEVIGLWQFQIQRSIIAVPTLILLSLFGLVSVRPKFWKPVLLRSTLIAFGMMWYFGALGFIPQSQSVGWTIHITHLGAVIHGAFSGHPRVASAVVCSLPVVPWRPYGLGHLGGSVFIGFCHAHRCGIILGDGGDCDARLLQPRNPKRDVSGAL